MAGSLHPPCATTSSPPCTIPSLLHDYPLQQFFRAHNRLSYPPTDHQHSYEEVVGVSSLAHFYLHAHFRKLTRYGKTQRKRERESWEVDRNSISSSLSFFLDTKVLNVCFAKTFVETWVMDGRVLATVTSEIIYMSNAYSFLSSDKYKLLNFTRCNLTF